MKNPDHTERNEMWEESVDGNKNDVNTDANDSSGGLLRRILLLLACHQ